MKTRVGSADRLLMAGLCSGGAQEHVCLSCMSYVTRELGEWDRSAEPLELSSDGKTLYTTADDNGDHALFAIDIGSGKATRLGAPGQVEDFDVYDNQIVVAEDRAKPLPRSGPR